MRSPPAKAVPKRDLMPFELGYRMPAEWEPHEATWLAWPHNDETWPGRLREIEEIYLQMIEALLLQEKVHLLVNDERERDGVMRQVRTRCGSVRNLVFFLVETVDAWIRDYGPHFILRDSGGKRERAWVKWGFNAWGGKYESLAQDDKVGEKLASLLGLPVFYPQLVLEGGSIDTNGRGTCLVTEQCLLNPNRNPHESRNGIEQALRNFLGFTNFVWLGEGIEGDDTDGHIDDIARFVNPTTVVIAVEENRDDPNEGILRENLLRLREATNPNGKKFNVIPIPMPDRVAGPGGRLPASYLNFYIANGLVLVPIFGQSKDKKALGILQELFPHRKVLGIRSETLILGLGAIHCVTHEQPAGNS